MTVTHVTMNSLLGLSSGPAKAFALFLRACDGEYDPSAIIYVRSTIPTCPRCAVLRDEALEGRLPQRDASGSFGDSPGVK